MSDLGRMWTGFSQLSCTPRLHDSGDFWWKLNLHHHFKGSSRSLRIPPRSPCLKPHLWTSWEASSREAVRGDPACSFSFLISTVFPLPATFPQQRKAGIGKIRPGLWEVTAAAERAALNSEYGEGKVRERDGYQLETHNLENRGISLVPTG